MTLRSLFFLGLLIVAALCLASATPASYFDDGAYEGDSPAPNERDDTGFDDYSENDLENILQVAEKRGYSHYLYRRGCIRRGGNCDYRASDCCVNSACRCNLWGANCRCQRRGIFQKWGK
uniref:Agatoxin-like peptide variant 1 isoform a n=2 Tax=Lygus hesperus TaxID=30085 RepID=A0A7T7VQ38_LYGHE|nr:agatoxin-like peptide precursor variant 1 isoform a [Lygus hesperus]